VSRRACDSRTDFQVAQPARARRFARFRLSDYGSELYFLVCWKFIYLVNDFHFLTGWVSCAGGVSRRAMNRLTCNADYFANEIHWSNTAASKQLSMISNR
jgi:hypothetical protein